MKGQLFQIKNEEDEELMLLWCSDAYIRGEDIEPIISEWWNLEADLDEDIKQDNEALIELLEVEYKEQGITFERVYTEEIII